MQKLSRQTKRDLVAYSFIAPNFIGFCVFTLIPIIFAFALAFMKWDGSNPIQWAGLSNFTRLWKDTFFIAAFKNTIIYCVGTVPLTMIASLALAIVLNQKVIGRGVFRTLSFFPYVASLVAITAVWKMLFHPSKGPVNNILLNVFNVPQDQLPQWFTGGLVLFSMILFSVWKYMGYYMVIYLAEIPLCDLAAVVFHDLFRSRHADHQLLQGVRYRYHAGGGRKRRTDHFSNRTCILYLPESIY